MNYQILIADDETEIRELFRLYLEKDGYKVLEAASGPEALDVLKKESVDLAVLDIMMPGMSGLSVLKKIRENSNIPVMILSSKSADSDKILGLDLGADDYLTKPFNPLEAVARINSNIRRFYSLGAKEKEVLELSVRDLKLDTERCCLFQNGTEIELTSVEYRIMVLFMENPGKVFTKQQVFSAGWQDEYMIDDNSIMVSISKLRSKLNDQKNHYIKTIRGLGYRLEAS
ncbi:MAG: response regulator transcription factor [Hespellia sp.]|jgi:DNA-binding response OmpR family regulator|nr:response regulator transcription factor [Hespellia sp.]